MSIEGLDVVLLDLHIATRPEASNNLSDRNAEDVLSETRRRLVGDGRRLVLMLLGVKERSERGGLKRVLMLKVREAERRRRRGVRDRVHLEKRSERMGVKEGVGRRGECIEREGGRRWWLGGKGRSREVGR